MYGICKTTNNNFNWGFCSRSCEKGELKVDTNNDPIDDWDQGELEPNEPYEEAEMVYHETAPQGSAHMVTNDRRWRSVYKCIKATLPRARNAFFELEGSKLKYSGIIESDTRQLDDVFGHVALFYGDSGSPIWTYSDYKKGKKKAILVAINGPGTPIDPNSIYPPLKYDDKPAFVDENPYEQCRGLVTKLTDKIVDWIKAKTGIANIDLCDSKWIWD